MTSPEPLEFEPTRALEAISRFGWHHVSPETPKSLLDPFLEQHGLSVFPGQWEFTITLVPKNGPRSGSGTDWEAIRKANADKRLKAAAAKKRRQA